METTVNQRFADLIKAMLLRGMVTTKATLGKESGIGKETIYRILAGKNVGIDKLALFYKYAGYISLHWLMTGEGNMFSKSDFELVSEPSGTYSRDSVKKEEYDRLQWLFTSVQKELDKCRDELDRFRELSINKEIRGNG